MGNPGGYFPARRAGLFGLALLMPVCAGAQSAEDGGLVLRLNLSGQLQNDDGEHGVRTDLGLALSSRTRSQSFDFGASAGTVDDDVEDPRLTLTYGVENRNSAAEFNLSYQRSEISDLVQTDPLDSTALTIDEGERETAAAGLQMVFGREAPFGATVALRYREIAYLDTTSTTLLDSSSANGAVTLRFDLAPDATLYSSVSVDELDRDGGTDTRRETIDASLEMDLRPGLSATADLGYARVITDGTAPRSVREGVIYGLSFQAERPNGTVGAIIYSDISENGRRTDLRLNRTLDLPRGALTASVGASRNSDTSTTDPLYALGFVQEMPRGQFDVDFSQSFSTTSTGGETLDSRLSVNLRQELSARSNLRAGLIFRDSDQLDVGGVDVEQINLNLTYSHALNERWDLFAGVSHIRRQEDGSAETTEDKVFFGLRTSVEWRP